MIKRKQIKDLLNRVEQTSVNDLLDNVRSFMGSIGDIPLWQDTDMLRDNYALMMKYMRDGIQDSSRSFVLHNMKQRCYQIMSDSLVWDDRKNNAVIGKAWKLVEKNSSLLDMNYISDRLEKYTSDITMTELLPDDKREAEQNKINDEHYTFMNTLFSHILCSMQWAKGEGETYTTLLTKPTISPNDQALMVSAITISAFEYFDINKLTTLLDTYLSTEADLVVRQRALVGFVLCLQHNIDIYYPEQQALVQKLFEQVPNAAVELLTLQKQIVNCIDVTNDSAKMSKEIIPTLIKNNPNLSITPMGIKEKEEDPMRDILDPGASEREMEEMEKSIGEMMGMMNSGADIYFSGFAQMKSFPFFTNISNWFRVFSVSHPLLRNIPEEIRYSEIMKSMKESMPFCDSDKYSFSLTLTHTLNSIPANLREMMLNGKMGLAGFDYKQAITPMFIRRTYLQDLYRFYRLYPELGKNLNDIFCKDRLINEHMNPTRTFFVADPLFTETNLNTGFFDLIVFLKKKGSRFDTALEYLVALVDSNKVDEKFIRFVLTHQLSKDDEFSTISAKTKLLMLHHTFPQDKWYTKNLAKIEFRTGEYDKALQHFLELREEGKEDMSLMINIATCYMYNDDIEEAYNILLPLSSNYDGDPRVEKAMAWCKLLLGKTAEGYEYYKNICTSEDASVFENDEILNAGYAAWVACKMPEAIRMLNLYAQKESWNALRQDMLSTNVLYKNGISAEDCELMLDIIRTE